MRDGNNPHKQERLRIFERFFDLLWKANAIEADYVSYDPIDQIDAQDWPSMADKLVVGQLREVINGINQFQSKINHLDAWARLIAELSSDEAHDLTLSHVSPIGFFCLCQPYALKERITNAATQIIHQGNRKVDKKYKAHLLTDVKSLKVPKWPTSSEKRKALVAVGKGRWKTFDALETSLLALNTRKFEQSTLNFRTSANHLIPPNFELGYGPLVTRYLAPLLEMKPNGDGTSLLIEHLDKPRPAYGFCGLPPLRLAEVVILCTEQHATAKACYFALQQVVDEIASIVRSQEDP